MMIVLGVKDLEKSKIFYQSIFKWKITGDYPVFIEFTLPEGNKIALYQIDSFAVNTNLKPHQVPENSITATELYLHAENLEIVINRLVSAGAIPLTKLSTRPWGDEAAYFSDPDGNVIAVARPLNSFDKKITK